MNLIHQKKLNIHQKFKKCAIKILKLYIYFLKLCKKKSLKSVIKMLYFFNNIIMGISVLT